MTSAEFAAAWSIAQSSTDLDSFDDTPLDGLALPGFVPVEVPLQAVSRFLRWQCVYMIGRGYDGEELERCRRLLVWPSRRVAVLRSDQFIQSAMVTLLGLPSEGEQT
jgi:hypothetical protein